MAISHSKGRAFRGALERSVPQARNGSFRPALFERWQRSERAMLAACGQMVLAGVSNRNVSKLAEEAFGAEVSPSLVSRILKDIEPAVAAFRTRPLGAFPYPLVDARFDKVREGHRVRSRAFLWAAGVRLRLPALVSENPYWSGLTEKIGHNSFVAPSVRTHSPDEGLECGRIPWSGPGGWIQKVA